MSQLVADSQTYRPAEYPYGPRPPALPPWKEPAETKAKPGTQKRSSILAAALAFAFFWADFSIFPLAEAVSSNGWRDLWICVLCGAMFAQVALLSMLLVFADGSFWRRLVGCWSAIIVSWSVWMAGAAVAMLYRGAGRISFMTEVVEPMQFFALALPLAALAVQAPLWFFRLYLGWRLRTSTTAQAPAQPLSIRDYLVGTGIAAVSMTLARLAPPATWNQTDYWPNWAIYFAVAASISAFSVVPALLLFRCRPWQLGYCLLILYGPVGGAVAIGITSIFEGPPPGPWEAFTALMIFVSFAVFLGLGLKAIQNLGYSLALGRSEIGYDGRLEPRRSA